jgi:virulence-associated protein VapD
MCFGDYWHRIRYSIHLGSNQANQLLCACISAKMTAELEMFLLAIRLIQNFRIEWPHDVQMKQQHKVLLYPDTPPNFKLITRDA